MNAIANERSDSAEVLEVRAVAEPVAKDDGVLLRVGGASVSGSGWPGLTARPIHVRLKSGESLEPKRTILGSAVAGG